ncbi:MAG: hypothetical protein NZT92_23425 [Abditibacteriales bacterium]|nr:hypothetical protein [Abditibacteriales bacterium]MDW8367953.1 hypothetical protein [Abditibacteriales bacterium]
MKTKWMVGLLVVSCLCLSVARSGAQTPEAERGEIVLVGWVLSVDAPATSFVMAVREYIIPHDRTYRLRTPRAVVVQVPAGVPIHVRWNASEIKTFDDIQPGVNVVACGPNKGLNQPLQANNIALWTRVEKGVFIYGPPPAAPVTPGAVPGAAGGETLIPLPPIASPAAKPTKPKAPASKPSAKPKAKSRSRR